MRVLSAILMLAVAVPGLAQKGLACKEMGSKWQQLVQEYRFDEMERLADQAVKQCDVNESFDTYYQAALTYLWRGAMGKAKPVVAALNERIQKNVETSHPGLTNIGISNTLPLLDAIYRGDDNAVEEMMAGYENMVLRSQEVVLNYLLRRNDPRFPAYYKLRKQMRLDMTPVLCGVYCKRNTSVKDCPCAGQTMPSSHGGPYSVYLDYLNGMPEAELRKEIDTRFGKVPLLKKEVMECLGMK